MDSDLAEALQDLKDIFQKRFIPANFGKNDKVLVEGLGKALGVELPRRYSDFLQHADPLDVETATPTERVRFFSAAELVTEQRGYGRGDGDAPPMKGWREGWIVIGHSALLGDPYFLDTVHGDAEGDCPVLTAMSGADLKPVLAASSFANFLRILRAAMELAEGFASATGDPDDEYIFREALEPKVRAIDGAALRAKHWSR